MCLGSIAEQRRSADDIALGLRGFDSIASGEDPVAGVLRVRAISGTGCADPLSCNCAEDHRSFAISRAAVRPRGPGSRGQVSFDKDIGFSAVGGKVLQVGICAFRDAAGVAVRFWQEWAWTEAMILAGCTRVILGVGNRAQVGPAVDADIGGVSRSKVPWITVAEQSSKKRRADKAPRPLRASKRCVAFGGQGDAFQQDLMVPADALARSPCHFVCVALNAPLVDAQCDKHVGDLCAPLYCKGGLSSIPPCV